MSDEGELGGHRSPPADSTDDDLTSHPPSDPISASSPQAGLVDRPAEPSIDPPRTKPPEFPAPAAPAAPASEGGPPAAPRGGWERSLFEGDQGPGVPGYAPVEPPGPRTPPKPGTPSSGNLRLPDWMRAEMSGDRDSGHHETRADGLGGHDDEEDENRTRLMLYFGVGLLVVALVAAGAVYVLKKVSGDADESEQPPGASGATPAQAARPPNVALPANKPLMRFRGAHEKAVGVVPDRHAGVAYPRLAAPWQIPGRKSGLGRLGWSGQQVIVTERGGGGRPTWYGQLLSGTLSAVQRPLYAGPGTERQAAVALAAQYDTRFYAFPHRTRNLASQPLDVDGHRGWLVASYIGYHQRGIKATAEVVAVAVVNTGRAGPAVIYMAIPNTNRDLWPDFNYVFTSLRLTT